MKNNKQSKPRILIILPTLGKRTDLLLQTLHSIQAQVPINYDIAMVFPLKEINTRKIAKDFGAIMVNDPGGLSAAINAGMDQSKPHHEYIGWINDDDLLKKDSLKTCITALDADSRAVLAFGYCDYIDNNNRLLFTSRTGRLAPWLMTWGPDLVPQPGILFRKSALDKAGIFDVTKKYSMDLDMLLRLRKQGRFINTKKTLASFRWHQSSITVLNRKKSLLEARLVKRKYLSKSLRVISPLWELPVELATIIVAKYVNRLAKHNDDDSEVYNMY